jgi:hypothetical protein
VECLPTACDNLTGSTDKWEIVGLSNGLFMCSSTLPGAEKSLNTMGLSSCSCKYLQQTTQCLLMVETQESKE